MTWLGLKTLAFIPLTRSNIPTDIPPPNWADQIRQRVFFDPAIDPKTGQPTDTDRSVRAYIHTVSSGLADLDVVVQLPEAVVGGGNGGTDVPFDVLEATKGNLLRANGFDGAAIVMLGGPGGGESGGYWSRFCMSDNLGNWVGELVHQTGLCNLPDLFDFTKEYPDENMDFFDQEAGYMATHFCAWTKRLIGWLDPSTVPLHIGRLGDYTLHAISLIQPPPAGRIAAVQIGQQVPYLMVEARLRADQFDINIPSEGVIIYQVQTNDPTGQPQNQMPQLNLLTKTALAVGQSFTTDNGVTVQVNSSVPGGGFSITVNDPVNAVAFVPDVTNDPYQHLASPMISNAGFIPESYIPPKYVGYPASSYWVQSQSPVGGTIAPLGSTVTCTLVGGKIDTR
jgi:hypothetical protein